MIRSKSILLSLLLILCFALQIWHDTSFCVTQTAYAQPVYVACEERASPFDPDDVRVLREIIEMNGLTISPFELGEQVWTNGRLTWLIIGHDGITIDKLPESIGQLSQLESLFLSGNNLSELPESIGKLLNLQKLYVDHNQLESIPESIGKLLLLEYLYLNHNKIVDVPASLQDCGSLQNLYLNSNYIQDVPDELDDMPRLENFYYQPSKRLP